jgi:DNA-binding beta-propeller fold protein YncE
VRPITVLLAIALLPSALAITVTTPGTVTTVVNPNLFTKPNGDEHLHGIARDPISGDIFVGDWNVISIGVTPFFGPYIENRDSIRRINALKEVSMMTYLVSPNAIAYNASDRQIYIVAGDATCGGADRSSGPSLNGVVAIDPLTGNVKTLAGGTAGFANGATGQPRFAGPVGIASDPTSGALFVSEGCENRIREVDPLGDAATLAGSGEQGNADGRQLAATFNDPHGIVYCPDDQMLYVADSGNNEIRAITFDGKVSTLAGSPQHGFIDGAGAAARFNAPTGVACDEAGNVYVADSQNNAVRKVTPNGIVTTVAGNGTSGGVDGVGSAARFSTPGDITYDPGERALFVVDWGSNHIRKIAISVASR